jgi:hypothetical protein
MPLELTITNEEKVRVILSPKTHAGQPAAVDGIPEWQVLTGDGTVDADEDGMSAFIVSPDITLGDTLVQVSADADIGAGVVTITDTVLLHVTGALAVNLGITAETPVPK